MMLRLYVLFLVHLFLLPPANAQYQNDIPVEIVAAYSDAVVAIVCEGIRYDDKRDPYRGSGFMVSPKGYIVTNSHVVPEFSWYKSHVCEIRTNDAKGKYAFSSEDVVGRDRRNDIAVIKINSSELFPYVPVNIKENAARQGSYLTILSYPLGNELSDRVSVSEGLLSNDRLKSGRWMTGAALNPGSSGGAVFNSSKEVVAVARSGIRTISYVDASRTIEINVDRINLLIPLALGKMSGVDTYFESDFPSLVKDVIFNIADINHGAARVGETIIPAPAGKVFEGFTENVKGIQATLNSAKLSDDKRSIRLRYEFKASSGEGVWGGQPPMSMIYGQVVAKVKPSLPKELIRTRSVSVLKDDHPNLIAPSQSQYVFELVADKGYKISSADFVKSSENKLSGLMLIVSPSREKATLSFSISSGPLLDRYRGWLEGEFVITQKLSND